MQQQIESETLQFALISQGNNSHIHRVSQGKVCDQKLIYYQNYVVKSVYHRNPADLQQDVTKNNHQIECRDLHNEWDILSTLDHPHIITPFKLNKSSHIPVPNYNGECCSIQMEGALCDYFNLLKNLKTSGIDHFSFPQKIQYFQQISSSVNYLHNQQISHNDIKLENILICGRETAKLADFGFSSRTQDNLVERWERRSINIYSAPEIVEFRNQIHEIKELDLFLAGKQVQCWDEFSFSEFSADVYALTTSLFTAVYQRAPVYGSLPSMSDPLYSMLCNAPDDFWELEQFQQVELSLLSQGIKQDHLEALKDLIENGLCDQDARISINEWFNHEFWKDFECNLQHDECKVKRSKY